MGEEFLSVFDLLIRKQREVQQALENKWNKENNVQLTNSEWFILDRINYGKESLADVCKNGEITRQGTHKLIQKLEERGIVETGLLNNKRNKYVELTPFGISCYEESKALKENMDDYLKRTLGEETYNNLRNVLESAWQLENAGSQKVKER